LVRLAGFRAGLNNDALSSPLMRKRPILLLVDDENNVLQTLRMVFEREGYDVITAESCADALSKLKEKPRFDAVITDLNMEREDIGLEVAKAALRLKPKPAVLILTGFASISNSRAALDLGVDYMANKPVELTDLVPALDRLVTRRRQISGVQ
jgi:ActR/RegA family two-component response regulator